MYFAFKLQNERMCLYNFKRKWVKIPHLVNKRCFLTSQSTTGELINSTQLIHYL